MGKLPLFQGLPRMLRALSALGMLLLLGAIVVMGVELLASIATLRGLISGAQVVSLPDTFWRRFNLGFTLLLIGMACALPTSMYMAHVRHLGRAWPRLETWQAQITAALVLATLPLCSLVLTSLISYTNPLGVLTATLNLIAALLLSVAAFWPIIAVIFG